MSARILGYILIFCLYLVNGRDLDLCNMKTNKTKLCKKSGDYRPNLVPLPWPTMVTPFVDLKSVIDVDENKKTMTLYLYLVTYWFDHEISVNNPNETEALPNTTQPCTGETAHNWYRIFEKEVDLVWRPDITFRKIVGIETLPTYGNDEKFQLWFCATDNHMEYFQAVKVTFACKFDFTNYPFDSHNCNLDFGIPSAYYEDEANFNPVEIIRNDSTTEILDYEHEIPNEHLPYVFSIIKRRHNETFPYYNFMFMNPFTGIVIKVKRKGVIRLLGTFYVPTGTFASLSMLSYFIHPDVVPGRMGLLVTLSLINSNIYTNIDAPPERDFSQIEVWMIGIQAVILLALMEYGFLLAWKRFNLTLPKGCKSGKKKAWAMATTMDDKMKVIDCLTFVLSISFFAIFNFYYWPVNYM